MSKDKFKLNAKQEKYAQEVVLNGGDKVAAYKESGWQWKNFTSNTLSVESDKKYNHPKISLRIQELQNIKNKVAKEEFKIDAAWVLKSSVELYNKCMEAEPLQDIDGNDTGYAKFQPAGAGKALELIGKHIDVQAYREKSELEVKGSIKVENTLKSRLTGGSRR